jgi:hypothetical protein
MTRNLYTIIYRNANSAHLGMVEATDDKQAEAVSRAYCKREGFHFVRCYPAVVAGPEILEPTKEPDAEKDPGS